MSEFEVQAFLFCALRNLGFDARANVLAPCHFPDWGRKAMCTFDIVIFADDEPQEIIEVKNGRLEHRKGGIEFTRQGRRYPQFGVPVTFVYGIEDARALVKKMTADAPDNKGR